MEKLKEAREKIIEVQQSYFAVTQGYRELDKIVADLEIFIINYRKYQPKEFKN